MIVAISSVRNESAIIGRTISHHLAQVDHIIISDGMSTDDTWDIINSFSRDRVTSLSQIGPFDQQIEILDLTARAKELGADWVVPFDADEFWCDLHTLNHLPASISKVFGVVYPHTTWDLRHTKPRDLPKVCYRNASHVLWGNHDADGCGPTTDVAPDLTLRELQYQSYDHYLAKIQKSADLYASYDFPLDYGTHMRELVAMSDRAREARWSELQSVPTVHDPIPYLGDPAWLEKPL